MAIIVSIPYQLVHVYRSSVRVGLSTCSTGKKGYSTWALFLAAGLVRRNRCITLIEGSLLELEACLANGETPFQQGLESMRITRR